MRTQANAINPVMWWLVGRLVDGWYGGLGFGRTILHLEPTNDKQPPPNPRRCRRPRQCNEHSVQHYNGCARFLHRV
jgi:hypothetical protein